MLTRAGPDAAHMLTDVTRLGHCACDEFSEALRCILAKEARPEVPVQEVLGVGEQG